MPLASSWLFAMSFIGPAAAPMPAVATSAVLAATAAPPRTTEPTSDASR